MDARHTRRIRHGLSAHGCHRTANRLLAGHECLQAIHGGGQLCARAAKPCDDARHGVGRRHHESCGDLPKAHAHLGHLFQLRACRRLRLHGDVGRQRRHAKNEIQRTLPRDEHHDCLRRQQGGTSGAADVQSRIGHVFRTFPLLRRNGHGGRNDTIFHRRRRLHRLHRPL